MTTGKIEKLPTSAPFGCQGDWRKKINELVDAVNELMDDKHPTSTPQAKPDLKIARQALNDIKVICDNCRWCDSNLYDPTPNDGRRIAEITNNALKQIEHKDE